MISEVSSFFFSISEAVFIFYSSYSRLILDYFHLFFKSTFKVVIGLAVIVALFYLAVTLFALFKRKVNSLTLGAGNEPLVTVQIPTFNELAALNCARRVINFDYPKSKLQIIIGDDSSDNEVSAKINDFALEENFKHPGLVKVTRRGTNQGFKPGNLNHMLRFSKGDFIVIFDSDFLPERDFLTKTLPHFKDRQVSGVQARWRSVNFDQNIVSILGGSISTLFHHSVLSVINNMGSSSVLCGSAEVVRKRDLLRLGGWVSGSLTEDIEYSFRLIKDGKRIVYLESVECDCEVPFTVKDLCKQQMRWAFGVITSVKDHFSSLFFSAKVRLREKSSIIIFASGYMFSMMIFLITILGSLVLMSERPAPVDWARFLSETTINLFLTSGFTLAIAASLLLIKSPRRIPKMVFSSLTVGLAVTYYVNKGILKALLGRKMKWFMLSKNGNQKQA